LFGVLGPFYHQVPGYLVRWEDPGAKASQLKAGNQCLAVSTQRCPAGQRGERAEPKDGRGESVPRRLADHSPNLGTGSAPGYIPIMALPVLNPPKSILWVDDEGELLEPHRIFLRSKGYTVEWASNADDAIELLRRRPFDILLLDEQMPGKRGLEVYRDVREIAPTLPVVMVTKSEEDSTLKEAIGVNIRDYLVKPINPRQVLTVVTRLRRAISCDRAGARPQPRLARLDRPLRRADALGRGSRCRR